MQVGFALGSGGAATVAQIGVLEEFEAAGIRATCVAATSGGSIVGAALCAGRLESLREALCGLTRRRVLWLFDPRWPRLGMLEGRRAMEFIQPYLGDRIEDFSPRYAAVATDLDTGLEVSLRDGSVTDAVRASVAIPGILTPSLLNGRLLVDGGLANPVPVSVARDLGARFVIAINVLPLAEEVLRAAQRRTPPPLADFLSRLARRRADHQEASEEPEEAEELDLTSAERRGLVNVIMRAGHVAQCHIAAMRLRHEPADFLVTVPVSSVGLFDFHRSAELVEAGRQAARQVLPSLLQTLARREPVHQRLRRWIASVESQVEEQTNEGSASPQD